VIYHLLPAWLPHWTLYLFIYAVGLVCGFFLGFFDQQPEECDYCGHKPLVCEAQRHKELNRKA
jgi:hypothetical protein